MNQRFWTRLSSLIAALLLSQAGAYLALHLAGISNQPYAPLIINVSFLLACLAVIRLFRMSPGDVGLKLLRPTLALHFTLCLSIFSFYILYYLIGARISGLRPITPAVIWALISYLIVAFAEEVYFRGILYHIIDKRYSGRTAVFISALVFAIVHLRQGVVALVRFPTGWLWASVRYSTGMIFLLIIPIHFAYNATWLIFQGNWDNLPSWAFLVPLLELIGGFIIMRASFVQ